MTGSGASRRFRRAILLCCAALAAVVGERRPAGAQDEEYRLGADDVIAIRVLYHPDFSLEAATVRPDGKVNVPVAGDVQVAGRTVLEVAAAITQALVTELRDPRVSVQLIHRHVEPIYVLGAVRSPGAVSVSAPVTVAQAIALAGGLSPTAAGRWGLLVTAGGKQQRIDVTAALAGEGAAGATLVRPGETLLVSAQFLVSVMGEVGSPGRYPVEAGDSVADLLAAAGGLTEGAASTAQLVRADGTAVRLELGVLGEGGAAGDYPALQPGDLIVVPEVKRRVTLVGAFREPGRYDFEEGDRVSHAVALAGGVAEDARLEAGLLVRRDGTTQTVDLEPILEARAGDDPSLADGDTLILPRKVDRVAVLGMVVRPGLVEMPAGLTLLEAIAAAGGWSQEGSRPTQTILWRFVEGEPRMTFIDAQALMRGAAGAENPVLQPGDIVFVPSKSGITRDEAARMLLGISGVLRLLF
ncbi:MAG: SLBB domain-containing protein [Armatimonadota bacterium]